MSEYRMMNSMGESIVASGREGVFTSQDYTCR